MKKQYDYLIYAFKILIFCVAFCLLITAYALVSDMLSNKHEIAVFEVENTLKIIIDAGHGGRDGGAISAEGILEKDLNLSVSSTLRDIFLLSGFETLMTREEDKMLCNENAPELKGKLKITDLKMRLDIVNENKDSVFISIHMNKFPIEKYCGLQVYYSPNHEKSFVFAKTVQDNVCEILQPENNRKIKKATSSIFLLDRITSPAILIECGFLSNPNEAQKLLNSTYQAQLSLIFANSIALNLQ